MLDESLPLGELDRVDPALAQYSYLPLEGVRQIGRAQSCSLSKLKSSHRINAFERSYPGSAFNAERIAVSTFSPARSCASAAISLLLDVITCVCQFDR